MNGGVKLPPSISPVRSDIGTKFQRLHPCFRGRPTQQCHRHHDVTSSWTGNTIWRPLYSISVTSVYNSHPCNDRDVTPTAKPRFSTSHLPMDSIAKVSGIQCRRKYKMAAAKPEVVITAVLITIETSFQRLNLGFRGRTFKWTQPRNMNENQKWYACSKYSITYN